MVSSALPVTPPRLACPTGREVFIGNVIACVNLPFTAWNETLLPAGQAGEGSRIALATSNLKTPLMSDKPTWGEPGAVQLRNVARWSPTVARSMIGNKASAIASHILLHVMFLGGAVAGHVTNLAKDLALRSPSSIVATEDPEDAAVRIRIAAVESVLVI